MDGLGVDGLVHGVSSDCDTGSRDTIPGGGRGTSRPRDTTLATGASCGAYRPRSRITGFRTGTNVWIRRVKHSRSSPPRGSVMYVGSVVLNRTLAGAVAGARHGASPVAQSWLDSLDGTDDLRSLADRLSVGVLSIDETLDGRTLDVRERTPRGPGCDASLAEYIDRSTVRYARSSCELGPDHPATQHSGRNESVHPIVFRVVRWWLSPPVRADRRTSPVRDVLSNRRRGGSDRSRPLCGKSPDWLGHGGDDGGRGHSGGQHGTTGGTKSAGNRYGRRCRCGCRH
jgi:hypothetical protein